MLMGIIICLIIAIPSYILGTYFPIIGGPVIAILAGMAVAIVLKDKSAFDRGIKFVSKKVLQWAVILLGFGMNLSVVADPSDNNLNDNRIAPGSFPALKGSEDTEEHRYAYRSGLIDMWRICHSSGQPCHRRG